MKNRYFGDVHDYVKYSLIRLLEERGTAPVVVCWMLTEEGTQGGNHTRYLQEPKKWRPLDPAVFDFLRRQVLIQKTRNVGTLQKSHLLAGCRFYSEVLTDDGVERKQYFNRFLDTAQGAHLAFLDPDNGVEVKSVKYGRKNSSKYVFKAEIRRTYDAGHSLLIYQHLPPKPRKPYVRKLTRLLSRICRADVVHAISAGPVVFLLVPQPGAVSRYRKVVSRIERMWADFVTVQTHHTK